MVDLVRYEPFWGGYVFSYRGELFLLDELEDEVNLFVVRNKAHPENGLSAPIKVQLQFTNRCNARCPGCYVSSGQALLSEMSDAQLREILRKLRDWGVLQIEWSGGEVFARKGFFDILAYAHDLGFEQNVLTNAVALGRKEGFAERLWQYVYAVQVSVDSAFEAFDDWLALRRGWESVMIGLQQLCETKPEYDSVSVTTTLDMRNLDQLTIIAEALRPLPLTAWKLAKQIPNGRSFINDEEADAMLWQSYRRLEPIREGYPILIIHPFDVASDPQDLFPVEWVTEPSARWFMYIAADGRVYPFPYYDGMAEFYLGHIDTSTLEELWNTEPCQRLRAVTRQSTSACARCSQVCRMWFRGFSYFKEHDLLANPIHHPGCGIHRSTIGGNHEAVAREACA